MCVCVGGGVHPFHPDASDSFGPIPAMGFDEIGPRLRMLEILLIPAMLVFSFKRKETPF